jgi:hypothetical protein
MRAAILRHMTLRLVRFLRVFSSLPPMIRHFRRDADDRVHERELSFGE